MRIRSACRVLGHYVIIFAKRQLFAHAHTQALPLGNTPPKYKRVCDSLPSTILRNYLVHLVEFGQESYHFW